MECGATPSPSIGRGTLRRGIMRRKKSAEEREDIAVVEVEDASYPLDGFGIILTLSPHLVHMSYRKLREFVQPDGMLFHGEDIDIYSFLLPHPVVVVPFVQH